MKELCIQIKKEGFADLYVSSGRRAPNIPDPNTFEIKLKDENLSIHYSYSKLYKISDNPELVNDIDLGDSDLHDNYEDYINFHKGVAFSKLLRSCSNFIESTNQVKNFVLAFSLSLIVSGSLLFQNQDL